jgi:hypothetical protein
MIMWLKEVYERLSNRPRTRGQVWPQTGPRHRARLGIEQLEDRLTPSNFTAATVSDLIADINAANRQGGTNTITLSAPRRLCQRECVSDEITLAEGDSGVK